MSTPNDNPCDHGQGCVPMACTAGFACPTTFHPSLKQATEQVKSLPELNMDDVKAKIAEMRQVQEKNEAVLKEVIQELEGYNQKVDHLTDLMIKYLERRT